MKKIMILFMVVVVLACTRRDENRVELILMGELPERGDVRIELYGYDKRLADHGATLIAIHRDEIGSEKVIEMGIPEYAVKQIEPPVKDEKDAAFYIRIEMVNGYERYSQDYEKNPFIEVSTGTEKDVYMKRSKK